MKYHTRFRNCIALASLALLFTTATIAQEAQAPVLDTLEKRAASDYARRAFQKALPHLDEAAERLGKHDALPRNKWFGKDQKSNNAAINGLLDEAITALGISEAGELRAQIRHKEARIANATRRIAEHREKRIAAPSEDDGNKLDQYNPFHVTKEDYDDKIAAAQVQVKEDRKAADALRTRFAAGLRALGLEVTDETAESLLATVSGDDFISMCLVFDNLKIVTLQLHGLVDKSGEEPAMVKRYYGMYVIIAKILDRVQTQYLDTIRSRHIPMLKGYTGQAQENIAEAKRLIRSNSGDRSALESNIAANAITIEAAGFYIDYLGDMAEIIEEQHEQTRRVLVTALNTYKTVDVSVNVGELIINGSKSLERLMQLEMPELRAFNNDALRREYQRLSDKMRGAS